MDRASENDSTSSADHESLEDDEVLNPWEQRGAMAVNTYPVTLRCEQEVQRSASSRLRAFQQQRDDFHRHYKLPDADEPSIINTGEANDLRE